MVTADRAQANYIEAERLLDELEAEMADQGWDPPLEREWYGALRERIKKLVALGLGTGLLEPEITVYVVQSGQSDEFCYMFELDGCYWWGYMIEGEIRAYRILKDKFDRVSAWATKRLVPLSVVRTG